MTGARVALRLRGGFLLRSASINSAPMADASFVDPIALLDASFRGAIARAFPQAADAEPLITASKQIAIADFQSNAAMGLAKRGGKRDVGKARA